MRAVDLIAKKRDGKALSREEIEFFIGGFVRGDIPKYQMAAFLMAVYFQGMTFRETTDLTRAMIASGETLSFPDISGPFLDKHSTGGVGDKISLVLAPMVAACGARIPMISGRALGHTGGTLDKLESIRGFRTDLSPEEIRRGVETVGLVITGQTETLVPADRGMYALRDATATVPSIPLIASSIMSKKIAEGIEGLVLDVKTGNGAFMQEEKRARALAQTMVAIGSGMGVRTVALITDMNQPLGRAVGNAVEVWESVQILRGRPKGAEDVLELSLALGAWMLRIGGLAGDEGEARRKLQEALSSGRAYEKFREMVRFQGGDPDFVDAPEFLAHRLEEAVTAPESGVIAEFDTYRIGLAATVLGAGRSKAEDTVDPQVGIWVNRKIGDPVKAGDTVFTVWANDRGRLNEALALLRESFRITETASSPPLIHAVIE